MKTTTEPLENRQLLLTIEVDEDRAQQTMRQVAHQIAKQSKIPGFRKGKAPYSLILQRYGEDAVRKEAADTLAQEVYSEALEQEEIESYAPAVLDEVTLHPITFRLTVPLRPVIELGDYRDYRLKPRKVRVFQKEVRQALERICEQNAILEPVDRPVALGDVAALDLVGQTADGVELLRRNDLRVLLNAESTDPAPGFAEAIVGMEAGEERTFTLALAADFPREELRGRQAEFTVALGEVYERILPALDDDLARTASSFDSLKKLQEHVKEQLRQAAQQKTDEEYAAQVLRDLLEQAQVEYPPMLLKEGLDETVKDFEQTLKRDARLSLEDYLHIQGQTMEELREELEPRAVARLKRSLVLSKVARLEGLEIDQEETEAHIEAICAPWGAQADEVRASLNSDDGQRAVRSHLLGNKVVQLLVAIAKGEAEEQEAGSEKQEAES